MQLDQSPFFRKPITPWYDSTFTCRLLTAGMVLVFFFALAGIFVASTTVEYKAYIWFPATLAALSGLLVIKVGARLKSRGRTDG